MLMLKLTTDWQGTTPSGAPPWQVACPSPAFLTRTCASSAVMTINSITLLTSECHQAIPQLTNHGHPQVLVWALQAASLCPPKDSRVNGYHHALLTAQPQLVIFTGYFTLVFIWKQTNTWLLSWSGGLPAGQDPHLSMGWAQKRQQQFWAQGCTSAPSTTPALAQPQP